MANRMWHLRQQLEATRAVIADLEAQRFETAHGWSWPEHRMEDDHRVLKKREATILREMSQCPQN